MGEELSFYDDKGSFFLDEYLKYTDENSVVLTNEDELVQLARSGDKKARRALVISYAHIAAELGIRLARPWMEPLEAIQEANFVLMKIVNEGRDQPAAALGPAIQEHFGSLGEQ